jgi:hypothetical protein
MPHFAHFEALTFAVASTRQHDAVAMAYNMCLPRAQLYTTIVSSIRRRLPPGSVILTKTRNRCLTVALFAHAHSRLLASPTLVHRHTLPAARSFSNLDDSHFRGHGDSVTLVRGCLVHSSLFSDIAKTHRDSVALAKKRMRERRGSGGALRGGAGIKPPLAERIAA